MEIAHIVSTFPPYQGGTGNVCYYQVLELAKRGYNVTVFTPDYDGEENSISLPSRVRVIRMRPYFKYGNAASLPQLLFRLRKFDIVHLHYPFLGIETLVFIKIFHRKVKFILQYQMDLVGRGWIQWYFRLNRILVLPLFLKVSDVVLPSSWDYLKNSSISSYFAKDKKKFIALANGVDTLKFQPKPKNETLLGKYELFNSKILLFVAGLDSAHYFKGLHILFRAIQPIHGVKLVVVGEGNLRQEYETLARDLKIADRVIFAGKTSDDLLIDFYNICDFFILPSIDRTEAFGIVLLEAMACAKPVIASDLPGVRTLFQENVNGFLSRPGDVKDLREKIQTMLLSDGRRNDMGQNALSHVSEIYNWGSVVDRLESIYKTGA